MNHRRKTIAIIGAGPVGLAAAAHALERDLEPLVLEAGPAIGHAVRQWSHVRMFSPWEYNIDDAARRLLVSTGWIRLTLPTTRPGVSWWNTISNLWRHERPSRITYKRPAA
jgi:2-polyprenyl-6-methoxyphenol hydroxylase-like FAD-dependent oxidoreductase